MTDLTTLTLGQWVQFKAPAPRDLKLMAIGGPIVGFGTLDSFPCHGKLPRIAGCDGHEHYALNASWLSARVTHAKLRARKTASRCRAIEACQNRNK
jgi:hypothetical protein